MYSVNVPVPGRVRTLANELYPELVGFETVREDHSCLLKRLGDADHVAQLQHRAHRALEGTPAVEARIAGIDYFSDPPLGSAPVVYLAVESPGLEAIHADLVDVFETVDGLEGPSTSHTSRSPAAARSRRPDDSRIARSSRSPGRSPNSSSGTGRTNCP